MNKEIAVRIFSNKEESYLNQLLTNIKNEKHVWPFEITIREDTFGKKPAVVLGICDYKCSAICCLQKFKFMIHWKEAPAMLLRPLLLSERLWGNRYFLVTLFDLKSREMPFEWSRFLESSSLFSFSSSLPLHPCNPRYKIAKVQNKIFGFDNCHQSRTNLAEAVGWTPAWLSTSFKKYAGICLQQFIIKARACKALWLLVSTDKPIKNITQEIGYEDPLYLAKLFKKVFSASPKSIRYDLFNTKQ